MTIPADRELKSPLEEALLDVHAALAELLVVADEQHAAIVAHDRDRLDSVTRQQERLSAQLARAEARRGELTGGGPVLAALTSVAQQNVGRADELTAAIGIAVRELQSRQAQTATLLQQSIDVAAQTLNFLQRLIAPQPAVYSVRGMSAKTPSLMVDSRA